MHRLPLLIALSLPLFAGCGSGADSGPPDEYAPLPPSDALRTQKSQTPSPGSDSADDADEQDRATSD